MTPANDLAKMVPGFDFLQGLMKNAGAGLPNFGQWVAPTLNPEELDKRIQELRTVQFWLEQNAKLLGTTIQALEVQRMTLATLKTMNLPLAELSEALKIKPAAAEVPLSAKIFSAKKAPTPPVAPAVAPPPAPPVAAPTPAAAAAAPGVVDPMQWWGALTQQFTELAAKAVKDGAGEAAMTLAGAMVKQGVDAASATLKQAVAVPAQVAAAAGKATAKAVAKTATSGKAGAKPTAATGSRTPRKR